MTLDDMALAMAAAVGVDGGCEYCESYVFDRLIEVFPGFSWDSGDGANMILTETATRERRIIKTTYQSKDDPPASLVSAP